MRGAGLGEPSPLDTPPGLPQKEKRPHFALDERMSLLSDSEASDTKDWRTSDEDSPVGRMTDRVFDFCRSPHRFLLDLALNENPVARFRINDEPFAVVSSPELVHAVATGSLEDFEKGPLYDILRMTFGESVFTADGQVWRDQQAILAPHFSRSRIDSLSGLISDLIDRQLARWEQLPNGTAIDMLAETKQLAFDVVRTGLLGIRNPALSAAMREAMDQIDRIDGIRLFYLSRRIPDIGQAVLKTALFDRLDAVLYAIVEEKLEDSDGSDDLIGALIRNPTFGDLTPDRQRKIVRDLIASMMTAGYVSTGEAMFWALHLLSLHPEIQTSARTEVRGNLAKLGGDDNGSGRGDRSAHRSLPYLAAVLNESLRLYPPAWFIGRTARRNLELGATHVSAGTRLVCSPFVLHRLPSFWPDPEAFRPERFLLGGGPVPRAYMPYGVGSRACLGRALAAMEMPELIGAILARFEVQPVSRKRVSLAAAFSTRPREQVLIRLLRA